MRARATQMRWRCPPEKSEGMRSRCSAPKPTCAKISAAAARRVAGVPMLWMRSGSVTLAAAESRPLSELIGSWKTICTSRLTARSGASLPSTTPFASISIDPEDGEVRCMMRLLVVDLPQPDSPTSPSVSPGNRSKLTPSTALSQLRTPKIPFSAGNRFCSPRTLRRGDMVSMSGARFEVIAFIAARPPSRRRWRSRR